MAYPHRCHMSDRCMSIRSLACFLPTAAPPAVTDGSTGSRGYPVVTAHSFGERACPYDVPVRDTINGQGIRDTRSCAALGSCPAGGCPVMVPLMGLPGSVKPTSVWWLAESFTGGAWARDRGSSL